MKRRNLLLSLVAGAAAAVPGRAVFALEPLPQVHVFKSPTCGCCGAWVEHMLAAGLAVPGVPMGSLGMEMGFRKDPFQVPLVAKDGRERVFSTYH